MNDLSSIHRFGPFEFDSQQHELREGGQRTTLSPALNSLLLLLVTRPGEVVTRDEIAAALWEDPDAVDKMPSINMAIKRLRDRIGDNNGHGIFIETVVGAGYRFIQPVEEEPRAGVERVAVEEATPDAALALVEAVVERPRRAWPYAVEAAAVLLLAAAAGWWQFAARRAPLPVAIQASAPVVEGIHPVTFGEQADKPTVGVLSPNGHFLAFGDDGGVWVQTLSTSQSAFLRLPGKFNIQSISWFPDETALLASGMDAVDAVHPQTWRISLNAAPTLWMRDAALAAVSPDGRSVAWLRGAQSELWRSGAGGEAPHRLLQTAHGDNLTCILWSPASDRILAIRFHPQLPRLSGADVGAVEVEAPKAERSSSTYFYESYNAGSGALLARRQNVRFDSAIVLKDGTLIYPDNETPHHAGLVTVKTDPATGAFLSAPLRMPADKVLGMPHPPEAVAQLSASANGQTISVLMDLVKMGVYVADLDSAPAHPSLQRIRPLSNRIYNGFPTDWSRDGRSIVFDDGYSDGSSVAGWSLDGARGQFYAQAHPHLDQFAQGHFSPDGRWLLYLRMGTDGRGITSIERVPAQGGPPATVPTQGPIEEFHCSASARGRCVLREVEGRSQFVYYALDPVTGMGAELARVPWQPNYLGDWTLSPDGATVAMANHDPARPTIQLLRLPPVGSEAALPRTAAVTAAREVPLVGFGSVMSAHWTPDGRNFLVETHYQDGYKLVFLAADGHATLLRQSPELIWGDPSPDGKKIAFPQYTPVSRNLWVGALHPSF